MKTTIELSSKELITAISNGTLLALAETSKKAEDGEPKTNVTDSSTVNPISAPTPTVEQQAPQQYQQPITQPPIQPIQTVNQVPIQSPIQQYQNPAPQPAQQYQAPVQQPQQYQAPIQQQVVPTAAQTYTLDQLATAATQLNDAGRRAELVNLLNEFQVPALTSLPKEQYGNFATRLRALGAKI